MAVNLGGMRDEMLPGLVKAIERYSFGYNDPRALYGSFAETEEIVAASIFNNAKLNQTLPAPSIPVALAIGAAAALIKNPNTTRRGLASWVTDRFSKLEIEP